jgi:DNA repair protein RadC
MARRKNGLGDGEPPPSASDDANLISLIAAGLQLRQARTRDGAEIWRIGGNTLAHRDALREAGGSWNRIEQVWEFAGDDPTASVARALTAKPAAVGHNSRDAAEKPHYHGHRQRVRDRALGSGLDGFQDYELLELLLFYGIERIDTKPIAKKLLERFGTLGDVFAADAELLKEFDIDQRTLVLLRALRESGMRLARREVVERPVITSWQKLLDYCHAALAHERTERFNILFLDRKNVLIADETQQKGTVDHTPVYPREVAKRALQLDASSIIMVHNHPSGDPTPSRADIEMTKEVRTALKAVGIELHDHLVIGRKANASFRSLGLL